TEVGVGTQTEVGVGTQTEVGVGTQTEVGVGTQTEVGVDIGTEVGVGTGTEVGGAHDVLVVGGGPSGASCAYWLAESGFDVAVVEKRTFPREKTCGDGLTPRAVRQLEEMGLAAELSGYHRYDGLRSMAHGRVLELAWPSHPELPAYGYVVTRHDLDQMVAERADKAGALVIQGAEATDPIFDQGRCAGAVVKDKTDGSISEVRARYVVVADGANSRFGRSLGTRRNKDWPQGMAIRGYFRSPRHDERWIESHLDIRDKAGQVVPGYGWIFPLGDGRVNVGVGLLSTFHRWREVNTSDLMDAFVDWAPRSWEISPATSCGPPTGGRLPMGFSVGPRVGRSHLIIGDAGSSINPFNGEGIAYGYETGRMAADVLAVALGGGGDGTLGDYERRLEAEYGLYFKVARAFVKVIGQPRLMGALAGTGMHSRSVMEWALRIMANILRPDEIGPAEAAYRTLAAVARMAPGR
ncbi:MAG: geranylgeranyl reductase family protein, partial [Acidimicrobiales bacterium]